MQQNPGFKTQLARPIFSRPFFKALSLLGSVKVGEVGSGEGGRAKSSPMQVPKSSSVSAAPRRARWGMFRNSPVLPNLQNMINLPGLVLQRHRGQRANSPLSLRGHNCRVWEGPNRDLGSRDVGVGGTGDILAPMNVGGAGKIRRLFFWEGLLSWRKKN